MGEFPRDFLPTETALQIGPALLEESVGLFPVATNTITLVLRRDGARPAIEVGIKRNAARVEFGEFGRIRLRRW